MNPSHNRLRNPSYNRLCYPHKEVTNEENSFLFALKLLHLRLGETHSQLFIPVFLRDQHLRWLNRWKLLYATFRNNKVLNFFSAIIVFSSKHKMTVLERTTLLTV